MKNRTLALALMIASAIAGETRAALAQSSIPATDRIRLGETFRLADSLGERLWNGWYHAPFAVLLVTPQREFLLRHPRPTAGFDSLGFDSLLGSAVWSRPRRFDVHFLATFPAVGTVPTIVVGEAESTTAKTSTPWVLTLLHEHLHQLQNSRSDYRARTDSLNLARGDSTGMWMIRYPFPYQDPEVVRRFAHLDSAMVKALHAGAGADLQHTVAAYLDAKKEVRAAISAADYRYMEFQLWQEGAARYTELRMAMLASTGYTPSSAYRGLRDVVPYANQVSAGQKQIEGELAMRLDRVRRVIFYSLGAGEALLLDRLSPSWPERYLSRMFSLDEEFNTR
jgi:hypothetical protein